ncbi:MAG: alanine--tRNA ligase [Bdellovibrionales bacterium]|nr:alanine--tRNA ligase [Bdellovibrionales bacterium]
MKSFEIRKAFINYFEKNGHSPIKSSSLVPYGDDTLLFTNAGMNQFKNQFLGIENKGYSRAVSAQKCVRAGGKHNDLDNVGFTARHHTFFEMLGNFSFGDYFKKDAIHFAWELLTKDLQIPKEKLYVTVFENDDEAAEIWHKQEGIPRDRIYRFGEKDNFWRMGDTGPCGPCSEIFYDHGEKVGPATGENVMGGAGDRFIEIWNLVFMQFNEDGNGQTPLPKPSIDTGAGLERLSAVLQGTHNNYETDLFLPYIDLASKISGVDPMSSKEKLAAMRVLADHARSTAFLVGDGVIPSNEGRGYVLRRIIRRAIRYGRKLGDQSLFPKIVEKVIQNMSEFYPELNQNKSLILKTAESEENRFIQTLDQGTEILNKELNKLKSRNLKKLDGITAFKLYDTFGFPVDLTELMSAEQGISVDRNSFDEEMSRAREKSQASWKGAYLSGNVAHLVEWSGAFAPTKVQGYTQLNGVGKILGISNGEKSVEELREGQKGYVITDQTPFYAESGGQVGDTGKFWNAQSSGLVLDCQKKGASHLHLVSVTSGTLKVDSEWTAEVDADNRRETANHHSATHLLHSALRKTLGDHVTQAGSLVEKDRLRFDFTHSQALTPEQVTKIENLVNNEIARSQDVCSEVMSYDNAIKRGAMALFGEKYGDEVRVIEMGEFSTELCGGTHVSNTSQVRAFKIVSEGSVSAGVRRIEAITGARAMDYLLKNTKENLDSRKTVGLNESWSKYLSADSEKSVMEVINELKDQIRDQSREIQNLKLKSVSVDQFIEGAVKTPKGSIVFAHLNIDDRKVLSDTVDKIRDKMKSGIVIVTGEGEGSKPVIVSVTKDLTTEVKAGALLGEFAKILGGKGGGRPDFAQGAVPSLSNLEAAKKQILNILN